MDDKKQHSRLLLEFACFWGIYANMGANLPRMY